MNTMHIMHETFFMSEGFDKDLNKLKYYILLVPIIEM